MRFICRYNPPLCLACLLLVISPLASAFAGDLPVASDGEHLWLIQPTPAPEDDQDAEPSLTLYHLTADTETYQATKLDPITGELMPRGFAAGDNELLLVTSKRQLITLRPEWSELMRQHIYHKRTLAKLPEGCTLLSIAMGDRGPWALIKVQSRDLLDQLDKVETRERGPADQRMLNKALGLPEEYRWGKYKDDEPKPESESADEQDTEPTPNGRDGQTDQADQPEQLTAQPATDEPVVEPTLPTYRLIYLKKSQWVNSPLPEGFDIPREAALVIRPGDDRPTILVDQDTTRPYINMLVRYNPVVPAEQADDEETDDQGKDETVTADDDAASSTAPPTWLKLETNMRLGRGLQWSAGLIKGQIVVAQERARPQAFVTIDTYRLRNDDTFAVGSVNLSAGDNARWAMLPQGNDIGLIVSPPPTPDPATDTSGRPKPLALLAGLTLDGDPMFTNEQGQAQMMNISEKKPTAFQGNANLVVQIVAIVSALLVMALFYRRENQQQQLDLPEHLVLASFGRRFAAAMVDLTPGFLLAGLLYDVTISETVLKFWPGTGLEKAFAAMRPGFIVIGVTLLHTTICEFILARSLGKIVMSMYVADLNGKPAPPAPCLGRALSKAFELFAPLMIIVAIIGPNRQRLGDILAKTIVVMRKPEPLDLSDKQDND